MNQVATSRPKGGFSRVRMPCLVAQAGAGRGQPRRGTTECDAGLLSGCSCWSLSAEVKQTGRSGDRRACATRPSPSGTPRLRRPCLGGPRERQVPESWRRQPPGRRHRPRASSGRRTSRRVPGAAGTWSAVSLRRRLHREDDCQKRGPEGRLGCSGLSGALLAMGFQVKSLLTERVATASRHCCSGQLYASLWSRFDLMAQFQGGDAPADC